MLVWTIKGRFSSFIGEINFPKKEKASACVKSLRVCVCLRLVSVCKWDHHRRSVGGGSGKFKIIRLISSLASFPFSVYGKWFLPLSLLPLRNGRNFFCLERTVVGAEMRKMGSKKLNSPKGKQPSRKPSCVVYSLFLDCVGLSKFGKICWIFRLIALPRRHIPSSAVAALWSALIKHYITPFSPLLPPLGFPHWLPSSGRNSTNRFF